MMKRKFRLDFLRRWLICKRKKQLLCLQSRLSFQICLLVILAFFRL